MSDAPKMSAPVTSATVFVSVGTDHHRFDRLVRWADALAAHPRVADVFVQRGSSGFVPACDSEPMIDADALRTRLAGADLVVCHGGPSTIMEARAHGHMPIVVPRDPDHGEHVDGHQMRFCDHLAAGGAIHLASSESHLAELVDTVLDAGGRGPATDGQAPAETLTAISNRIDTLTSNPRRRLSWLTKRSKSSQ